MANTLIPTDVYQIVNQTAKAMFGADTNIQAVDTSTFVAVGEAMLRQGYENTLNALNMMIGNTIIAVRPYSGKFKIISETEQEYGAITRKISFFYDGAEASQDWNTNINDKQLSDGSSVDHYKIRKQYPLEINFAGIKALQKHYTRFKTQLKVAFRSEDEFAKFYVGLAQEVANELEILMEAENRALVLNHIGALYDTGNTRMKVNLTEAFNTARNTTYTTAQLLNEHLKEFLAFFVETVKNTSDLMEEANVLFHLTPRKTNDAGEELMLLRHTPKEYQKLILYAPLIRSAEANVLPEIFHDGYLRLKNYEKVTYWQNPNSPASVSVKANEFDVSTGQSKDAAKAANIPYVVGMLFDRDALAVNYFLDDVDTTPDNAAGRYYNTFYHWAKQYNADFTENAVLFYMQDPGSDA